MRQNYEMSDDDLGRLQRAIAPRPVIMLQCGSGPSLQARANAAWAELGEKMKFDYMTVRPTGQGDRFFSAEALPA